MTDPRSPDPRSQPDHAPFPPAAPDPAGPPVIAILRGLTPQEAPAIGAALVEAGICRIEVPLNSPDPLGSIRILADLLGAEALVGAGTVLSVAEVARVAEAGGRLVVSPNTDAAVIRETRRRGLQSWPGVFTATECFAAIAAGATGLKLFPAEQAGPRALKALRAAMPPEVRVYAVGGAGPANFGEWLAAGAQGFGIGTALYRPGDDAQTVGQRAQRIVAALAELAVP